MKINISKTDWHTLCSLTGKAIDIIKAHNPSTKEYNVARRLWLIRNKLIKNNEYGK